MSPDDIAMAVKGLALIGVGGGGAWLFFLRKISEERRARKTDDAEVGLISRLQHERDEAKREAAALLSQRIVDVNTIADLTSDVDYWRREYEAARGIKRGAVSHIENPQVRKAYEDHTRPADLDDLPPRRHGR